ncbi:MAG TPA: ATP-binding cassette domain-containing protein [bacterium]|nr:ATP-binding cassette domain-containing protein [bacterium]
MWPRLRQRLSPEVRPRGEMAGHRSLIDLRKVVKTYVSTAGTFVALKGVDLRVDHGEFVAVVGKSGSGKTTLINMVTGIDRPTSGEVYVADTPVHALTEGQLAAWRGRAVGIVFQFFQLLPTLSLLENVMLPMDFAGLYAPEERQERGLALLAQVEMTPHAHKLPSAVSGGEQQRVAIARALANDPPLIIADEPTGNLDSQTAESVCRLFEDLVRRGKTIVMVTHDVDLARQATRSVIVADGEIVNQYVAEALRTLSVDQFSWLERHLSPETYAPGAFIIRQGEEAERFFVVTKGAVELVMPGRGGQVVVRRLGAGQYFGATGLMHGGRAHSTVRAAPDTGAQVMVLDRQTFARLVAESDATMKALNDAGLERIDAIKAAVDGPGSAS